MRKIKSNISEVIFVLVILIFLSCSNENTSKESKEIISIPENNPEVNDTSIKSESSKTKTIELFNLKNDLDTFVISVKNSELPFELRTDTVGDHSSDKELWAFNKGIFELINVDSTALLVRHYFSIPLTKRILRIYLLELHYNSITESNSFFEKLEARKYYKADLTGGYYLDFGLTGTTDYVIKQNETILWFNVSCQYSNKEYEKLIEIFRKNIALSNNEEVIKCFCHEACE